MKISVVVLSIVVVLVLTGCVANAQTTPPLLEEGVQTQAPEMEAETMTEVEPTVVVDEEGRTETRETEVLSFPGTVETFFEMIYLPCPSGSFCKDLEVKEISQCVGETNCWRAPREKDINGVITPYMAKNPSTCLQDGWMQNPTDRIDLGRKAPKTAIGSGVPSGYSGLLEGITFRLACPVGINGLPQGRTAFESIESAPPATAVPTTEPEATVQPPAPTVVPTTVPETEFPITAEAARETFRISDDAVITACVGEPNCWQINANPSSDGFFSITNTSSCWLTGYAQTPHELMPGQIDPKTGFPPEWEGRGEAAQLRPC